MDWIIANKEWVFSGCGVAVISAIIPLFLWFQRKKRNVDQLPANAANTITNSMLNNSPVFNGDNNQILINSTPPQKKKHLTKNPPKIETANTLIGRDKVMGDIHAFLQPKASLVITGIGGIGKTEVCRKYFWQMEGSVPYIGWINYSRGIKEDLVDQIDGLEVTYDPKTTIDERFDLLYRELNQLPPETVLIIDNVSNSADAGLKLLASLPFRILVSARGPLPYPKSEKPLDFLSTEDCQQLFRTHYKRPSIDEAVLNQIIERAGRHTLTVELLAKTAQAEKMNLQNLLDELGNRGFDLAPAIHAKVGVQWSNELPDIVFNHLRKLFDMAKISESKKDILSKIALLAPIAMDFNWVKGLLILDSPDDLNHLIATGWLQSDEQNGTVWMHRVLQDVVRREALPQVENCLVFVQNLSNAFNCGSCEHLLQKKMYLPHAISLLEAFNAKQTLILAFLSSNVSLCERAIGNYPEALKFQFKAVESIERILTPDHSYLANSYSHLSLIYSDLGDANEALKFQLKAVEIHERVLPPDHPDLATSFSNLSLIYLDLGNANEALNFQLKAVEIHERVLPPDHSYLANSYSNMSVIYCDLGDANEALKWQLKAINIRERVLPPDHPDLAISYNNLSLIYSYLGNTNEAFNWQLKATNIRERVLTPDHPDLAISYNNLSVIYRDLGDNNEALKFQLKAVEIIERVLTPDHPNLATSYNNLSSVYRNLGYANEALKWQLKAIEIRERVLPSDHPDLAASYNNMSSVYRDLGDNNEALKWQLKAIEIIERVLTPGHPDLATSYHNLSSVYRDLGDANEALKWQLKATNIRERVLTPSHPDLANSYNNLSTIYRDLGDNNEALKWQLKAVEINERVLTPNHPVLATVYSNLSIIYHVLGDSNKALKWKLKAEKTIAQHHN